MIFGFSANATVQPIRWIEPETDDFGRPLTEGSWVNDGDPVDVVLLPMKVDEKVQAGIHVDTEARKLYFNLKTAFQTGDTLGPGQSPITTRHTLDIGGKHYNVKGVDPYDVPDFPSVGKARIVRQ